MGRGEKIQSTVVRLTLPEKFIICLMYATKICFSGTDPKNYKSEEKVMRMTPPRGRSFFKGAIKNLVKYGVVLRVKKRFIVLTEYGIEIALALLETNECRAAAYEVFRKIY